MAINRNNNNNNITYMTDKAEWSEGQMRPAPPDAY